jgi:hypothetical protein
VEQAVTQTRIPEGIATVGRRFGYAVAIGFNLLLVWIVGNLADWEVVSFLTAEFADLVPLIQLGLWVTIVAYVVYFMDDRSFSTRAARLVVDVVNLFVTFRVFDVFPFDFSAHSFNWGFVFRAILLIALVGTAVSAVVHLGQLIRGEAPPPRAIGQRRTPDSA